jgi:ferric-dicitrate binding protein FerR (iron transport regulator)
MRVISTNELKRAFQRTYEAPAARRRESVRRFSTRPTRKHLLFLVVLGLVVALATWLLTMDAVRDVPAPLMQDLPPAVAAH